MSELALTLRQPAQLGDRARKDFVLSTMDHIPGAVVRGALAAAWLARNGVSKPGTAAREEFLSLFEGGVRYGPLLSEGSEAASLSVISHKYAHTENCAHVEIDCADQDPGYEPPFECPDCGSPMEQSRGLRAAGPGRVRRTSVAIGVGGTAREGELFTRESLKTGQVFRGPVIAEDPGLLGIIGELGPVRVGGRRTTHGRADIQISNGTVPPAIRARESDGLLVLRLRSPGVFTDDHGRPSRDPNSRELKEVLGTPVTVLRRWTRWEEIGGWHAASGLPKPQELAVSAGSTYLLQTERIVADAALAELSRRGVGLRRHEGYGDLAPAPMLTPGKASKEDEARRIRELAGPVRPILGLLAHERAAYRDRFRELIYGHVHGDAQKTGQLRQVIKNYPDKRAGDAVKAWLALSLPDAKAVLEELQR